MWNLILAAGGVLTLALVVYMVTRVHRISFIKGLKSRLLSWVVAAIPVALTGLFALVNFPTLVIVVAHLGLAFALCDLAALIVRKTSKKKFGHDVQTYAAFALTIVYLGIGFFMAYHVFETDYEFSTEKSLPKAIRIVEIADSHLGITLDGERFSEQMERVAETNPDLVVIVGDFVDDDSEYKDMVVACEALGRLKTTYGVYFVYGNHDDGYFNYRDFTSAQLREHLAKNNVIILEDQSVLIDDSFYLIGRKDRSMAGRMDMQSLVESVDLSKYTIVLDHQPNDYAAQAQSKVDLVLSGHTHGGHVFPGGLIGIWSGANDKTYGTEVRQSTRFLVTSGISGWAIPFKTGTFSEFVVIDIVPGVD